LRRCQLGLTFKLGFASSSLKLELFVTVSCVPQQFRHQISFTLLSSSSLAKVAIVMWAF